MVNGLPCKLPEAVDLGQFKERLSGWRTSVQELLNLANQVIKEDEEKSTTPLPPLPTVQRVEELVEFAKGINVELKELRKLKQVS